MNKVLENLIFGFFGYKLGSSKCGREFTQEEVDDLIHSFLSQVPLDAVIDCWMDANNCDTFKKRLDVAYILDDKANHIL